MEPQTHVFVLKAYIVNSSNVTQNMRIVTKNWKTNLHCDKCHWITDDACFITSFIGNHYTRVAISKILIPAEMSLSQ